MFFRIIWSMCKYLHWTFRCWGAHFRLPSRGMKEKEKLFSRLTNTPRVYSALLTDFVLCFCPNLAAKQTFATFVPRANFLYHDSAEFVASATEKACIACNTFIDREWKQNNRFAEIRFSIERSQQNKVTCKGRRISEMQSWRRAPAALYKQTAGGRVKGRGGRDALLPGTLKIHPSLCN